MGRYTRQDIMRIVEEEDIGFIRLQFTDIFGAMRNVAITTRQLEKALDNQIVFDGSSIAGFAREGEADMYLHPDLDTFTIFPWRPQQCKVARIICDVYGADGMPFAGDCRHVLKSALSRADKLGYTFEVGPECEFFLFNQDENGQPTTVTHEMAGYFEMGPADLGENARRDIVLTLEDMGFEVEESHHELSPAQHEVDFKYAEGLQTADNIITFKLAVKTVAKRHGLFASFMPKPRPEYCGSGMHMHLSLLKDGRNAFADPAGKYGLSEDAYYFMGGLMAHIKGMCLILNPLVNSYKRLVPGFDAPCFIAWSGTKRSPLIRLPRTDLQHARLELRSADSSANPYLAIALCLAAGLDGIKNRILPPDEFEGNISGLNLGEAQRLGIEALPQNLQQAVDAFKEDELIRKTLGEYISEKYISTKQSEWDKYNLQVTPWEIEEYLYKI
ncbi:MAG: type I glutamate--ammonia ligase [Clostridiales bacterium]|nr:type I glutamate--ammonia ligase [Clostridiales bacterium]